MSDGTVTIQVSLETNGVKSDAKLLSEILKNLGSNTGVKMDQSMKKNAQQMASSANKSASQVKNDISSMENSVQKDLNKKHEIRTDADQQSLNQTKKKIDNLAKGSEKVDVKIDVNAASLSQTSRKLKSLGDNNEKVDVKPELDESSANESISRFRRILNHIPHMKRVTAEVKDEASPQIRTITDRLNSMQSHAERAQHIFGKIFGASLLSNTVSKGFSAIVSSLHEAIHAGAEYDKEQQVMGATWDTLTDSASKGSAMVKSVNNMSTAFGQSTDLVNELDQQFYHVFDNQPRTEKLTRTMLTLADTLGMSGEQVQRLGLNFTHMMSSGRLQVGDFNMITDQLPMYGRALLEYEQKAQHNSTLTMAQLRKEMSAGKISAQDAETVIEGLGRRYSEASENMMKTLPGMERTVRARVPALVGAFETPFQHAQSRVFAGISRWVSQSTTEKEFTRMGAAASRGVTTIVNAFAKVFGSGSVSDTADSALDSMTKGITRFSNYIANHAPHIVKFIESAKESMVTTGKIVIPIIGNLLRVMRPVAEQLAEHPKLISGIASSALIANKSIQAMQFAFGGIGKILGTTRKGFENTTNAIKYFKKDGSLGNRTFKWTANIATSGARHALSALRSTGRGMGSAFRWVGRVSATAARKALSGIRGAGSTIGKGLRWTAHITATGARAVLSGLGSAARVAGRGVAMLARGFAAVGKAILTNPIGLAVTVILALAAAFIYAYRHSRTFRNFINGLVKDFREWFGKLGAFLSGVWKDIRSGVSNLRSSLASHWSSMLKNARSRFSSIASSARSHFNDARKWAVSATNKMADQVSDRHSWLNRHTNGAARAMFSGLKKTYRNGHHTIEDATSTFRDIIHGRWSKVGSDIRKTAHSAMSTARSYFRTGYSALNKLTGGWLDKTVGWFKKLPGRLGNALHNGWKSLRNGAIDLGNGMLRGIGKPVNGVIDGINWVLKRVGARKFDLKPWPVPQFAKGGKAMGLFVAGEAGPELMKDDKGHMSITPNHATLYHANAPVQILGASKTRQTMNSGMIPKFAGGNWLGTAWDFLKSGVGEVANIVMHPVKSVEAAVSKFADVGSLSSAPLHIAEGAVKTLVGKAGDWIKDKIGSLANPSGAGVERWKPYVIRALSMNGLSASSAMVAKVLRQIQTESSGNPRAIQHGYTDVNALSGDLAKGLMQTISATFNAYKFAGHGNIFNGFDNLLAALNYAKHRYGKSLSAIGQGHGYAAGTLYSIGGKVTLGEREPEIFETPTGTDGIVTQPTAFNNFPAGSKVIPLSKIRHFADGTTQQINKFVQTLPSQATSGLYSLNTSTNGSSAIAVDIKPMTVQVVMDGKVFYQEVKKMKTQETRIRNLASGKIGGTNS
ncbi:MAG: tape measure protein [Sporolactobacillus sp.]